MKEYLVVLRSLSESTRLRILAILHQSREACVSDIVEALQENQYKISRHLKVLLDAEMVVSRKTGRWVYYQLNRNQHCFRDILLGALKHISSDVVREDLHRYRQILSTRPSLPPGRA